MMPVLALSKSLFNFFLVSCIITPLAVSYWRGTWYILDLFVFPEDKCLSAWITFAASFGVIYLIMFVEDYLKAFLNERKAKRVWYLVMFYPLAFLIVTSWRGLWMLLDYYTTSSLTSGCVSHAVGFFIVSSLKTTSTVIAVPGYCISERNVDPSESFLEGKICFRSKKCQNYWADIASRMANSFVTVFVIGSSGICYWRGTWIIVKSIKHPACPENNLIPSIIAISQGFAVLSICYCLSEFITTKRLDHPFPAWCRALEVVFVYILGFGVVTTWVGLWFLEDIYLFPDQPTASALVCHFVGISLLYLLQGTVNLIGFPAGCRIHHDKMLEGLDMGSYLKREKEKDNVEQNRSEIHQGNQ